MRLPLQLFDLVLLGDFACPALYQDTPASPERLVETVGLEADLAPGIQGQEGVRCGTEDDSLCCHGEVDRQHHHPLGGRKPDAADSTRFQQVKALSWAERPQVVPVPGGHGRSPPTSAV